MTTNVNFGIILVINGEDVALEPAKAITDAKKNGVEFSLPRRVEIGTAEDLKGFLENMTGDQVTLPSGDNFPAPLNAVYKKLTSLNLAVEELNLKVPPTLKTDGSVIDPPQPTTFALGMSATWSDDNMITLIASNQSTQPGLAIKGLYVKLVKT